MWYFARLLIREHRTRSGMLISSSDRGVVLTQSRIVPAGGLFDVVDEVQFSLRGYALLPAGRQGTQVLVLRKIDRLMWLVGANAVLLVAQQRMLGYVWHWNIATGVQVLRPASVRSLHINIYYIYTITHAHKIRYINIYTLTNTPKYIYIFFISLFIVVNIDIVVNIHSYCGKSLIKLAFNKYNKHNLYKYQYTKCQ